METTVIRDLEGLKKIQQNWENLETRAKHTTIYNSFSYVYNWAKSHTSIFKTLFIVCVFERNTMIGIGPMMITRHKLFFSIPLNKITFLGKGDYFNFIVESRPKATSIVAKIFDTIYAHQDWDKLDLTHIQKGTVLLEFLLKSNKYNKNTLFFGETPILLKDSYFDFNTYKINHVRKNVNNYYNKLKKNYQITIKTYFGNECDVLNRISQVHISRNSIERNRRSIFNELENRVFLEEIYAQKNNTITLCLESEDEIISYVTCYTFADKIHIWNNSYNLDYKQYSPGDIIYLETLKYFFSEECPFKVLDFGGGRYPWKFQMTNNFHSMYRLNINTTKSHKFLLLQWYDRLFEIGKILLKK